MNDQTLYADSVAMHRAAGGKLGVAPKVPLDTARDLALAYSPGVAGPCQAIAADPTQSLTLTMRGNTVAVLTDGSAVLGLGNIGPAAAMPVMEGKAALFKAFADVDAVPICADVSSDDGLIAVAKAIAPGFGGINLEDIAAPRCFVVEDALQGLGIPVFHDDQHGTAIALLAALTNGAKVVGKPIESLRVVINGAGAAGSAIAKILRCVGHDPAECLGVADVVICDSRGIVSPDRDDLNAFKRGLLGYTNPAGRSGDLRAALRGADVLIGVSKGNLIEARDVRTMAADAIILAMANPTPEIMPDEAARGGAAGVGTGRSDLPNQVNNVLVFPGLFRGALNARAQRITGPMKLAAVRALAAAVETPTAERILPDPLDKSVAERVAAAVREAAVTPTGV
ncbi:MAG: malic enzyme-like NAD(P)-binding protein [Planctomycetota bacterium]